MIVRCGGPVITNPQTDRRHRNLQRRIPGNPGVTQLSITERSVKEVRVVRVEIRIMVKVGVEVRGIRLGRKYGSGGGCVEKW